MANLLFELPKGGAGPLTKSGQFGVAQVSNRFQPNATNFWNEHYLSMRFCSLSETPLGVACYRKADAPIFILFVSGERRGSSVTRTSMLPAWIWLTAAKPRR